MLGLLFVAYLVNYYYRSKGVCSTFTGSYLNDLLCMPIILSFTEYILYITRKYHLIKKLSIGQIIIGCMYVSIVFEWIMPHVSNRYIADKYDIVCYALGGLIYYIIQNFETIYKKITSQKKRHEEIILFNRIDTPLD